MYTNIKITNFKDLHLDTEINNITSRLASGGHY